MSYQNIRHNLLNRVSEHITLGLVPTVGHKRNIRKLYSRLQILRVHYKLIFDYDKHLSTERIKNILLIITFDVYLNKY